MSLQINLCAASASIVTGGGGEKSIGVRETQESKPRSPAVTGTPSQPAGAWSWAAGCPSCVSAGSPWHSRVCVSQSVTAPSQSLLSR